MLFRNVLRGLVAGFILLEVGCRPAKNREPNATDATSLAEFHELQTEHAERRAEHLKIVTGNVTVEQRAQAVRDFSDYWMKAIDQMLAIAERQSSSEVGKHAALWIVRWSDAGEPAHVKATELLLQHHVDQPELVEACERFDGLNPIYERILRQVHGQHPSRSACGYAAFELAELLTLRCDFCAAMAVTPELQSQREQNLGKETINFLQAVDRRQDRQEARELYVTVKDQFDDLPFGDSTLGQVAAERLKLWDQTYSEIGTEAPEILGRDLNGQSLQLSSFKGQVVVLTFWASWCGPCVNRIPEENDLVRKYQGKPFALLGVNCDEMIDDAKRIVVDESVQFRSWWDDPSEEVTIVQRYDVSVWPTTFIIDQEGVIRYKDLHGRNWRWWSIAC